MRKGQGGDYREKSPSFTDKERRHVGRDAKKKGRKQNKTDNNTRGRLRENRGTQPWVNGLRRKTGGFGNSTWCIKSFDERKERNVETAKPNDGSACAASQHELEEKKDKS